MISCFCQILVSVIWRGLVAKPYDKAIWHCHMALPYGLPYGFAILNFISLFVLYFLSFMCYLLFIITYFIFNIFQYVSKRFAHTFYIVYIFPILFLYILPLERDLRAT